MEVIFTRHELSVLHLMQMVLHNKKTNDTVQYASRASSMWVSTALGWKILHSSYAPRNGKIGIPEVD